jgi:ribonuclease P protein component
VIRAERLTGRSRFEALRLEGARARGDVVRVRVLQRDSPLSCGAIAVRGSKSAVLRNRARRRLRAALDPVLQRHPGCDVLVAATVADAVSADFRALCADVEATISAAAARPR